MKKKKNNKSNKLKNSGINKIIAERLSKIILSKKEFQEINYLVQSEVKELESNINKSKIKADVFVGGSFRKGTLVKKDKYDIDIFIRFDRRYDEPEINMIMKKIVAKKALMIHGSRDYYSIKKGKTEFEIIPVYRIKKPEEAKNTTDLSYFHVTYILKKLKKNNNLAKEIILTKDFMHSQECYGAESYIRGFSGYAVELLVIYYKEFINFIKAISKFDLNKKLIIDIEKRYRKQEIFREMNESKLESPIILVDPTFKKRNALAALSLETLAKLKAACREFIKNPSDNFFQLENKEEKLFKKYGNGLQKIELITNKQKGDIAGTKLKKFAGFFIEQAGKYFYISWDFEYKESENKGIIYIVAKAKKQIEFSGPPIDMKQQFQKFRRQHKKIIIKKGRAYAYEKNNLDLRNFVEEMNNKKEPELMGIKRLELV